MKRVATMLLVAGLLASPALLIPGPAYAGVDIGIGISVGVPPPPLPVYAQPMIPGPGYIWTPGYWAWNPAFGYYWVPGAWVMPPQVGLLWTPGWWGWSAGYYRWNPGYWGTHVGFYGGVNYGFGYAGTGYTGGYWRGNRFFYNRAVNNVNITNVRNVYVDRSVVNNVNRSRVSYNGGRGGIAMQPSAQQRAWAGQRRFQPTTLQTQQRDVAAREPAQRFNTNRGRPAVFATQRAGSFTASNVGRPQAPRAQAAPDNRTRQGLVEAPRDRTTGSLRPEQAAQRRAQVPAAAGRQERMVEAPRNRGARQAAQRQPQLETAEGRQGRMVEAPQNRGSERPVRNQAFERAPAANRGASEGVRMDPRAAGYPRSAPPRSAPRGAANARREAAPARAEQRRGEPRSSADHRDRGH